MRKQIVRFDRQAGNDIAPLGAMFRFVSPLADVYTWTPPVGAIAFRTLGSAGARYVVDGSTPTATRGFTITASLMGMCVNIIPGMDVKVYIPQSQAIQIQWLGSR